jgi:CubicO group peptidase (beta-lactamase class C family)
MRHSRFCFRRRALDDILLCVALRFGFPRDGRWDGSSLGSMIRLLSISQIVLSVGVVSVALRPLPPRPVHADGYARLRHVDPEEAGMSAARLAQVDLVMQRAIEAGGFPGAAVIIGRRDAIVWERGYGRLDYRSNAPVQADSTLYDVASLTKVVATAAAAMVLVDRGKLQLDDPVSRYLPEFARGDKARVTVRDLLTHRSGLPPGRALSRAGGSVAGARQAVLTTALAEEPGERTIYSDLGADALGFVIERVSGEPLDEFVRRSVFAPLGMRSTMFRPPPSLRARAAPTMSSASRGVVHDGNARALGGVAGHAGLFTTAADLAVFARMMLDHGATGTGLGRIVRDSTVSLFTRRTAGWRALGWDTCAGGGSCGHYLGSTAFGHTGFTGTSIWIDPERELFVIVLTNWVYGSAPWGTVAPVAVLHDVQGDVVDLAALSVRSDEGELPRMPMRLRSDLQLGWYR